MNIFNSSIMSNRVVLGRYQILIAPELINAGNLEELFEKCSGCWVALDLKECRQIDNTALDLLKKRSGDFACLEGRLCILNANTEIKKQLQAGSFDYAASEAELEASGRHPFSSSERELLLGSIVNRQ